MPFFSKATEVKKKYESSWNKTDLLGSGNFANVYKAKRKSDGVMVAIKVIDKAKVEDMEDVKREVEIMDNINHDNIIKLHEIYDESKKMNLVMELVTGGELFDRIVAKGHYSESDAASVIKTLCTALAYLHEKSIVHRDLKPENLLYSDPSDRAVLKVADFGLARVVKGTDMMKTACGTPGYVAPEILRNKGYNSGAVDVWSAGVIMYILLCGFPPFYEEELPALFQQILACQYDFPSPWWDGITKPAKDLIGKMLTLDPKKRIQAVEVLKDPWILNPSGQKIDTSQLKKFNATRKLKKAAKGIMAAQKMSRVVAQGSGCP